MDSKQLRLLGEAWSSIQEGYGKKEEKKEGECVDKEDKGKHNCAKKVCHESFGEGTCIFGEHAVPDENGFVSHYDVMFEHGIEKNVPVADMEVLEESSHNEDYHRYAGEQIDEGDLGARAREAVNYQRGGYHGDADYFKKHQDAIDQRLLQMRPYGVKGFPSVKKDAKKITQVAHYQPEGEQIDEGEIRQQQQLSDYKRRAQEAAEAAARQKERDARGMKAGPNPKPGTQMNSVDLFDIVKGHLMSEGYADTEEAALAIMANMSEEWRQSIIESGYFPTPESQREDEKKYNLSRDRLPGEHKPQKPQKPQSQKPGM